MQLFLSQLEEHPFQFQVTKLLLRLMHRILILKLKYLDFAQWLVLLETTHLKLEIWKIQIMLSLYQDHSE